MLQSLQKRRKNALEIISILEKVTKELPPPMVTQIINLYGQNPYLILISCLMSLRARDTVTFDIVKKLFELAQTPKQMLKISLNKLEQIVYSAGFYKKKAKLLHEVSEYLIKNFNGQVPNTESELLKIKGVGPKTANLVLAEAFGIPAICVDTHVHRISNKLGWVKTKTSQQTERELKLVISKDKWIEINRLLVVLGQNLRPNSPFCSIKLLAPLCSKK